MLVTKLYFFLFFVFASFLSVKGQGAIEKNSMLNDKFFYGGGIGMSFGSVTSINISPMVGYKPMDNIYLGLKAIYQYQHDDINNFSTSIYGGSLFGLGVFFDKAVFFCEYELVSLESEYYNPQLGVKNDRFWLGSPLVGGGISQSVGSRSKILFLLLWNLNDSDRSPYSNPIIKVLFLF